MEFIGNVVLIFGLLIILFALAISLIKAYGDDVRGIGLVFAIFKYRPWLVLSLVGLVIFIIGQLIRG